MTDNFKGRFQYLHHLQNSLYVNRTCVRVSLCVHVRVCTHMHACTCVSIAIHCVQSTNKMSQQQRPEQSKIITTWYVSVCCRPRGISSLSCQHMTAKRKMTMYTCIMCSLIPCRQPHTPCTWWRQWRKVGRELSEEGTLRGGNCQVRNWGEGTVKWGTEGRELSQEGVWVNVSGGQMRRSVDD